MKRRGRELLAAHKQLDLAVFVKKFIDLLLLLTVIPVFACIHTFSYLKYQERIVLLQIQAV